VDLGNADSDADGVGDACDLCPTQADPAQLDADRDGIGDACDVCPAASDPAQSDRDGDGAGDACDADIDGDGLSNSADNCPLIANAGQADANLDGVGDACDPDADGFPSDTDVCPTLFDPVQADDGDGAGDACDNCLLTANPRRTNLAATRTSTGGQLDDDADGFGNACDPDLDGDFDVDSTDLALFTIAFDPVLHVYTTVADVSCGFSRSEPCDPLDFDEKGSWVAAQDLAVLQARLGGVPGPRFPTCGADYARLACVGDACVDADQDGADDRSDVCPGIADPQQADLDADGAGDLCDNCVCPESARLGSARVGPAPGGATTTQTAVETSAMRTSTTADSTSPEGHHLMRQAVGHHVADGSRERDESCAPPISTTAARTSVRATCPSSATPSASDSPRAELSERPLACAAAWRNCPQASLPSRKTAGAQLRIPRCASTSATRPPACTSCRTPSVGAPFTSFRPSWTPFATRRAVRASISNVGRPVAAIIGITRSWPSASRSSSGTDCGVVNGPLRVRHSSQRCAPTPSARPRSWAIERR
jgi:hypothetical protein